MSDEKPFSYVRLMREIRDQVNLEISGLSVEEEKRWFAEQQAKQERSVTVPDAACSAAPLDAVHHRC